MPRKGKGSKIMQFKPLSNDSTDCIVCGYPKEWKVHHHG